MWGYLVSNCTDTTWRLPFNYDTGLESLYVKFCVITGICSFQSHRSCQKTWRFMCIFFIVSSLQIKTQLWISYFCMAVFLLLLWLWFSDDARRSLFYKHRLTLIPAWISNYIHYKVWDENIYQFPNFNRGIKWINNSITHLRRRVITYPCWDILLVKGTPFAYGR